jgi:hypothetical protein
MRPEEDLMPVAVAYAAGVLAFGLTVGPVCGRVAKAKGYSFRSGMLLGSLAWPVGWLLALRLDDKFPTPPPARGSAYCPTHGPGQEPSRYGTCAVCVAALSPRSADAERRRLGTRQRVDCSR